MMKKIIGVCLAKAQSELSRFFMEKLHYAAKTAGYKLLVFNSNIDFKDEEYMGAQSIYYMIPYEKLTAIVILQETIYSDEIIDDIISGAKRHDVPVIMARDFNEDCISVVGSFDEAYGKLLKHIIVDHKVTDFFFIGGMKIRDRDTNKRLACFMHVLDECNIPLDESRIDFGEYWEKPAIDIVNRLHRQGKLPQCFVCANDVMAAAVCRRLIRLGYRIPEDIYVVGFDGLECAMYSTPYLTTCCEDMDALSEIIISVVDKIQNGEPVENRYVYPYKPIYGETCGCDTNALNSENDSGWLFAMIRDNESDETYSDLWFDNMIHEDSRKGLLEAVPSYLDEEQYVMLRNDKVGTSGAFIGEDFDEFPENLLLYSGKTDEVASVPTIDGMVIPDFDEWIEDESVCVVSALYVKNLVMGVYFYHSMDIRHDAFYISRHIYTFNRAIYRCLHGEKQRLLQVNARVAKYEDPLTKLKNMEGLQRWFEDYSAIPTNHDKLLAVCAFSFINYEKLLETQGSSFCDEAVAFIANNLQTSHPRDCVIARVAVDGFVVVMFAKTHAGRGEAIYTSVDQFYNLIAYRNQHYEDAKQIEVSSGSVDLNPGWKLSMNQYISSAYNELYKNRMAQSDGEGEENRMSIEVLRQGQTTLRRLISENLFVYHFQPIVDARNGEIFAYEALMRTGGGMHLPPLEVLEMAKRHRHMYDIEHATFYNVMKRFATERDVFKDRRVFINTIPGYFLNELDLAGFREQFGEYMDNIVVEITEDDTMSMEELEMIRGMNLNGNPIQIAVDDYGTGHSNIVNLIKYRPQVVKVDRFLMTDIHKDRNKQLFVKNVVDFARENNILVLAEGVETREEMEMAIKLKMDLIQGFYTAKPSQQPIDQIAPEIKQQIIDARAGYLAGLM